MNNFIALMTNPNTLWRRLQDARRPLHGPDAMLLAGVSWATFCLMLYLDGQQPSFTGIPIPAEHYYLVQTVFITPVLILGWWLFSLVGHGMAKWLGGEGSGQATRAALGYAYGVPLTLLYVIPDIVVYLTAGFDALPGAMRIYSPLCLLAILVFATLALKAIHGIGGLKSFGIALVAFMIQTVPVAAVVR